MSSTTPPDTVRSHTPAPRSAPQGPTVEPTAPAPAAGSTAAAVADPPAAPGAPHLVVAPGAGPGSAGVSVVHVVGSALAAVSAAVVSSSFGVAGTMIGAAVASVIATVGSAVYSASLRRTNERLRRLAAARRTADGGPSVVGRPLPKRRQPSTASTLHGSDVAGQRSLGQRCSSSRWPSACSRSWSRPPGSPSPRSSAAVPRGGRQSAR